MASPKIPKAADAAKHKAGGGNVQICQQSDEHLKPMQSMWMEAELTSSGQRCVLRCAVDEKVKVIGSPKIPLAKDAAKHKAGGGNVEICTPSTTQRRALTAGCSSLAHTHSLPRVAPSLCCGAVSEKVDFKAKAQAKVPSARVSSSPSSRDGSRRNSLTLDDSLSKTVTDVDTSAA